MEYLKVKIWNLVEERYELNEDGELALFQTEEAAKQALREEGYKEEYIDNAVEYHPHYKIDTDGYEFL